MSLGMYSDDGLTQPILQEEKVVAAGTTHTLTVLTATTVQNVYKYSGGEYTLLVPTTDYSIVGSLLTLIVGLASGEHLIVMPSANINMVFTGAEGAMRSLTKKIVLNKTGAFVYDALRLYSEDFTIDPVYFLDAISDQSGFTVGDINGYGFLDANGVELTNANCTGLALVDLSGTPLGNLTGCCVLLNDVYVGDVLANDDFLITLPFGVVIPTPNFVSDKIEILSTGKLLFALGVNGSAAIPGDSAFKKLVCVPTLTAAAPTQTLWMRESLAIPAVSQDLPNLPFKITGQEYPE